MFGEGISKMSELIDVGVKLGIVQKSGAWFNYGDIRLGQGRDNAKQFLKDNPEIANDIEGQIRANADKLYATRRPGANAAAAAAEKEGRRAALPPRSLSSRPRPQQRERAGHHGGGLNVLLREEAIRWPKKKSPPTPPRPVPGHGASGRAGAFLRQLYERSGAAVYPATAAAVVAEMVERQYVDDERYARTRAHGLLAARKSRRAAAQDLRQKGLDAQQISAALEEVYAPDEAGGDPELDRRRPRGGRYRRKLAAGPARPCGGCAGPAGFCISYYERSNQESRRRK